MPSIHLKVDTIGPFEKIKTVEYVQKCNCNKLDEFECDIRV